MNIVTGQIGNAIESVAPDHVVTTSHGIYDQSLEQYQDEINEYLMSIAGNGATYLGVVPPSANPGSQISRVFAFATQAGTYTHFLDDNDNPIVIEKNGLYVLSYIPGDDDYWTCTSLLNESNMPCGVYDISANRAGTSYSSLASALGTNGAYVPAAVRKGGMSIKYIDSNTNKYVQWRYLLASVADADIANVNNWQGVDQYPTDGSENLVKSKGIKPVFNSVYGYLYEDTKAVTGSVYSIGIQVNLKKGTVVEFSLDSNDGAVVQFGAWAVTYPTGEVTNVAFTSIGQSDKYTLTDDCSRIRLYAPVTTGGTITSKVETKGLVEKTGELESRTTNLEQNVDTLEQNVDTLEQNVDTLEQTVYGYIHEDTQVKESGDSYTFSVSGKWKKDSILNLSFDLEDGAVLGNGGWSVTYPTGEVINIPIGKYILTDDCTKIRVWYAVATGGTITGKIEIKSLIEENVETKERLNALEQDVDTLKLKNFGILSILGDSYSTYGLWNPTGSVWYAIGGEDGQNSKANDVNSVSQTWWYKLCNKLGVSLLLNDSYNGSPICNTGYNQSDASGYSFVHRMLSSLGQQKALSIKPNIITIFGGTNDSWDSSPIGELKYSGWTENDLKSVLPAMCYMFDYVKKWNPGALIINVVNTGLNSDITNGFADATAHYGIKNVVLNNIGKDNGHPNISGMNSICNQIYQAIISDL